MIGVGIGVAMRGYVKSQFTDVILAILKPVVGVADQYTAFNNLLSFIIAASTVSFFIFTLPRLTQTGPMSTVTKIGRLSMMVAFGAIFGSTVMGRLINLISRLQFLLFEVLRLTPP